MLGPYGCQDIGGHSVILGGGGLEANWEMRCRYLGYAVTCGILFTCGGVRIDNKCSVLSTSLEPITGLYDAGEMAGGLFYHNYPAGSGLSARMVFGRLAGTNGAQSAIAVKD